jgi:hypothetical protein
LGRNTCTPCENLARKKRRKQQPIPTPEWVEVDVSDLGEVNPLEQAYKEREERDAKKETQRKLNALIDENTQLKSKIGDLIRMQQPPEVIVYDKASWERVDAIACADASDWHVEEEVIKESVHGLNEYNLDIAKYRSEMFFQNTLRLTDIFARESKIDTINVDFLGDFFSGHIHEELKASTLLAPGDAARFVKGLFISGIEFLLRESSYKIVGDMIPGNHGRMTEKMWFSDPTGTSLETFMYHAVADYFRDNPRVSLNVSAHAMVYRTYFENFTVRKIHGYEVKYGGGVGGITIPINKAIAQWDIAKRASLTKMGHFHQRFDGGSFVVNGSLIGYNTFAQAIKARFEEAKQQFYLIHARGGGEKSITAPIWLDEKHHA